MKNEDRATTSAKGGLRPATVKGGSKQPTRRGNILDLLILFILVAALIGIGYRYYTKSNPSRAQELSEVEIAFEIRDAVFTLPSYVKTGDVLYFEDGTVFGTIKNNSPEEDNTALYVQSAAVIVSDESGNYIRIAYPDSSRVDAQGKLSCRGVFSEDGTFLHEGTGYITAGTAYRVYTENVAFTLTVTSVTPMVAN